MWFAQLLETQKQLHLKDPCVDWSYNGGLKPVLAFNALTFRRSYVRNHDLNVWHTSTYDFPYLLNYFVIYVQTGLNVFSTRLF